MDSLDIQRDPHSLRVVGEVLLDLCEDIGRRDRAEDGGRVNIWCVAQGRREGLLFCVV